MNNRVYYANHIQGNPKLASVHGKCHWVIDNIDANATVTVVYETETNQIVLPNI